MVEGALGLAQGVKVTLVLVGPAARRGDQQRLGAFAKAKAKVREGELGDLVAGFAEGGDQLAGLPVGVDFAGRRLTEIPSSGSAITM